MGKQTLEIFLYNNAIVLISSVGGFLFAIIGLPMGWMIGSMFVAASLKLNKQSAKLIKRPLHPFWKHTAQIILAIQAGKQLNASVFQSIKSGWSFILLLLLFTFMISIFFGWIFAKMTKTSMMTGIFALSPGGVSTIPVLANDMNANSLIVSSVHFLRVVIVATTIPAISNLFIPSHAIPFLVQQPHIDPMVETALFESLEFLRTQPLLWTVILCISAGFGFSIFRSLKLPSPLLIGSLIGVASIQLFASAYSGITMTAWVPHIMIIMMQIFLGASVGSTFHRSMLEGWKKSMYTGAITISMLIIVSIGCAWIIHQFLGISMSTSILSFAPGGLAVMTATAITLKANVSFVIAVQTIRLLFILILLPPLFKQIQRAADFMKIQSRYD